VGSSQVAVPIVEQESFKERRGHPAEKNIFLHAALTFFQNINYKTT